MAEQKKLKEEIERNSNLKLLTRSYQEHAIGQINLARYSVLSSREFVTDLEEVFRDAITSYKVHLTKKDIKNIIKKNGKDVWVLITSNSKLYGDIVLKICKLFLGHIKHSDLSKIDLIVVGKQGKDFIDANGINKPYKFYEMPDSDVTEEALKDIYSNLLDYENVVVFYGKFDNLVSQIPVESSLTGKLLDEHMTQSESPSKQKFLFEPSIEEVLEFFQNQILSLLLNQTVKEAQLARFASRISAMEIAQENIQKQLIILLRRQKTIKNMEMNKKQLELLSGRSLWGRR